MSIIRTEQLTKRFGEVTAVDAVSFAVERGEIFAFLGPNGAGKSTTIKMLTTLLTPTSGHIEVDGHDPTRDPAAVRRTFGIIFQDPNLDTELWQGPASENGRSVNFERPLISPIGSRCRARPSCSLREGYGLRPSPKLVPAEAVTPRVSFLVCWLRKKPAFKDGQRG